MINIDSKKAKVHIRWNVSPYDYSVEAQNRIISIASQKYGLNKESIKVIPQFNIVDENGEVVALSTSTVNDIQDPNFQQKLFKDYLKVNDIQGYNFDIIEKIDADINSKIDYQAYEKFRKYSVKYIKFSNFLSYGENNLLDFSDFKHFVLIKGAPANTSGKTTLAVDLLHFLLFGKTDKAATQDGIFNTHAPEATKVEVEGCIVIDGEEYIIRRVLSRPALDRRTAKSKTTQKVEYYKVVGESKELLEDYIEEDLTGNDSRHTNKIIKEAIGKEEDFNLIMSITGSNLDDLIEKKDTERGRLLARWIGLLPIEEKEAKAKEKYNLEIKPYLKSNTYNQNTLNQEIEGFTLYIKTYQDEIKRYKETNVTIDNDIENLEKHRASLLSSKRLVDENVLKLDITTLETRIANLINEGKGKASELEATKKEIEEIGVVEFSNDEYDQANETLSKLQIDKNVCGNNYRNIQNEIASLKSGEYCPTCGRKYDNIDNSAKINEKTIELQNLLEKGKSLASQIESLQKHIITLRELRDKNEKRGKLLMKQSSLEYNIQSLRAAYQQEEFKKSEYLKNKEAIDINNKLDVEINSVTAMVNGKRQTKESNLRCIQEKEYQIKSYTEEINKRNILIKELIEEIDLIKNWKIYLDMVGKNGISKMVLRKTLPIINARLKQLLDDVVEFDVEITLNNKNEAKFEMITAGKRRDLSSASGFERTCSALALRSALASVSTMPSCNYITLDEVLDRVANENLEKAKVLMEKIAKSYDFLLLVFHKQEIQEWCDKTLTVWKKDNISYIRTTTK